MTSLGTLFLVSALVCAVLACAGYGIGAKIQSNVVIRNARILTFGTVALIVASFVVLEIGLFSRDYSFQYVYEHTANTTGKLFTFTAVWAGLEGSLLLWLMVLCGYTLYVVFTNNKGISGKVDATRAIAHMVMLAFMIFFLLLIITTASPFEHTSNRASNGLGANPLLQEHFAMAIHPPMLYIGYVGFCVPFAYLIASLITKDFSTLSTTRVRRSSTIAWAFLTAGILLGAWWSYEVLGWGGYWAWDPVENASLLPWLTATAFLHSTIMQTKSNMLRGWNATIVIATCALTILGTFLTRSGIVNSVHAFTQSHVGAWLLGLFAAIVLGGAGLLVWRFDEVRSEKSLKGASKKETMFLLNNVVFCIFALAVLLGTTYPLIADSLRGEQLSVGTPYYEKFAIPFGLSVLFLMGVAPTVAFRDTKANINEKVRIPAVVGVILMALSVFYSQKPLTAFAIGMCSFVVASSILILRKTIQQSGKRTILERPRKVGAMIVHIGIAFAGLALVLSSHTTSQEVTLAKGESTRAGNYEATFVSEKTTSNADIVTTKVAIKLVRNGKVLGTYAPKVRTYPARNMSVGTPSVHTSFVRDTYLTLVTTPVDGSVVIKIAQNPAVSYLWVAGLIIIAGSIITLLPGGLARQKGQIVEGKTDLPEVKT